MTPKPTETWAVPLSNLPAAKLLRGSQFADLEHNPVFQLLLRQYYLLRGRRAGMLVIFTIAGLVLGTGYSIYFFRVDPALAVAASAAFSLVILVLIAVVYLFAGIEGYETNGNLRKHFGNIVESGIQAEVIASAIWARTVFHYNRRLVEAVFLLLAAVLTAMIVWIDQLGGHPLLSWAVGLGILGSGMILGGLQSLETVTLPGTSLLYRGVLRGYRRKIADLEGQTKSFFAGTIRSLLFLPLSLAVVLVPLASYLYLGDKILRVLSPQVDPGERFFPTIIGCVGLFVLGFLAGGAYGLWSRATAPKRFKRFALEIEQLFELRRQTLYEHS